MGTILTHWGRVTHICLSTTYQLVSDNGLSPVRRQAITWNNVAIMTLRNIFVSNLIYDYKVFVQGNALDNVVWDKAPILSRPQCVNTWIPPLLFVLPLQRTRNAQGVSVSWCRHGHKHDYCFQLYVFTTWRLASSRQSKQPHIQHETAVGGCKASLTFFIGRENT